MIERGNNGNGVREAAAGDSSRQIAPEPGSLSLVLPMFNEADSVEHTLEMALRNLEPRFSSFEIVVVDDGSTDNCGAEVQQWAARDSRIVFHRLERNSRLIFFGDLVYGT